MKISANGKEVHLARETSVKELLEVLKVEMPEYVTVQLNDEFVERASFETIKVEDGDSIEFIYYMGGGR